jgi:hypothetical protein
MLEVLLPLQQSSETNMLYMRFTSSLSSESKAISSKASPETTTPYLTSVTALFEFGPLLAYFI